MKTSAAAIRVGLTAILVAIIAYGSFKFVGKGLPSSAGYEVWALFRDATGLVEKSRVQIAGLVVGEITGRELQGSFARITIRVKPDVKLWSNAAIYKRSASLLGEFYLEIDPGTPESPDPLTGRTRANYPIEGCFDRTHDPSCNQIKNVVEAVTTSDVLVQVSETLPVLRDILRDVQEMTSGPVRTIAKDVESGIRENSQALVKLIQHSDQIVRDVGKLTSERGPVYDDIRVSMDNVRQITESIKSLVGSGEGHVNTAGDKLKHDLDQLSVTLEKMNKVIDQASDVVDGVQKGQGTVGKLLKDDSIANNVNDITGDAADFVRSITRLQTIVGIHEEYAWDAQSYKTYLTLKLQPRPDKFYYLELVDDPRGSRSYNHTTQVTSVTNPAVGAQPNGGTNPTILNTDNYVRTPALRFTFEFAKRIEWRGIGITGRLGIKESTGGGAVDFDFWKQRIALSFDLFDFTSEKYPRLKMMGAIEVYKHLWVLGGIDDLINDPVNSGPGTGAGPTTTKNYPNGDPAIASCGPATPRGWCTGGRDYFFGARLTFNDDDLRALLTVGGTALSGAGR
jgi:phospholipid/cholesterol/gamma-HCH transport system substrate-binding protein